MFGEEQEIKIYAVTLKKVIQRLEEIKDVAVNDFAQEVENAFEGYDYDGEEELAGWDEWPDISNDGKYELNIKIDHEDAYEFTLYVDVNNAKATVVNVL